MSGRERLKRWGQRASSWLGELRAGRAGTDARNTAAASSERKTLRELGELSWPIAAAMLGETAIGLVDTRLVGGLGARALGGVGLATVLMYLNYAVVFGLMRGVKVRTSYAIGEGRPEDGLRYAQAGAVLGVFAGAVVFVLCRDVTWALRLLRVDASMVPYARDFLAARTYGAVATCVMAALIQHRQGMGDSRTPMLIGLGGNLLNATLAYGLIYGRFGLPALGVRGAGYGTAITETVEALVLLALLARASRKSEKRPTLSLRAAVREVTGLGLPTGLHFGLETLAFTAFTAVLGSMGPAEIAAHQLALNVIRASFLPGIAVAEAASVMIGRALGAGKLDEADRVLRAALKLAVGFMTACGVIYALFGGAIARVFTRDPEVIAITRGLLLVAAVFQACDASNVVLRGALRGAKDVRWVAFVGTTVVWTCVPGSAWLLGYGLGWGAFGGWCGFVFETSLATWLLWMRWWRGPWRQPFMPEVKREPTLVLAEAR